jgi:hypothetical protein
MPDAGKVAIRVADDIEIAQRFIAEAPQENCDSVEGAKS